MSIFCKHDWDVKDKTILPSSMDEMTEHMKTMQNFKVNGTFRGRILVLTLACKKCGSLEVFRTYS